MQTASLATHAIGRAMALACGVDAMHAIKRVDRLLSDDGIDPEVFFPARAFGFRERVAATCSGFRSRS